MHPRDRGSEGTHIFSKPGGRCRWFFSTHVAAGWRAAGKFVAEGMRAKCVKSWIDEGTDVEKWLREGDIGTEANDVGTRQRTVRAFHLLPSARSSRSLFVALFSLRPCAFHYVNGITPCCNSQMISSRSLLFYQFVVL